MQKFVVTLKNGGKSVVEADNFVRELGYYTFYTDNEKSLAINASIVDAIDELTNDVQLATTTPQAAIEMVKVTTVDGMASPGDNWTPGITVTDVPMDEWSPWT